MEALKHLPALYMLVFCSCGSSALYSSYTDWDANSNNSLDRYEFVNGYAHSNYFRKWSENQKTITYEELYEGVFKSIDTNSDN
jgi:hypothetical protein